MKFPEALRLADAMGLPDLRGYYIEEDISKWKESLPPCCAIGGANVVLDPSIAELHPLALYLNSRNITRAGQTRAWGLDKRIPSPIGCPAEGCVASHMTDTSLIVMHLYDLHKWSRTQIADFLDTYDEFPEVTLLGPGAYLTKSSYVHKPSFWERLTFWR